MLLAIMCSGCTRRVWFTQPMREAYTLGLAADHGESAVPKDTKAALEEITGSPAELQYFVSDRLVLQREVTSRDDSVTQGRIRVRKGRFIERVVVRRGTPGVATTWGDDWVEISFEEGSALRFDLGATQHGEASDIYSLHTADAEGPPKVRLGEQEYEVHRGATARLRVRKNDRTKKKKRRHVLRGRKIDSAKE